LSRGGDTIRFFFFFSILAPFSLLVGGVFPPVDNFRLRSFPRASLHCHATYLEGFPRLPPPFFLFLVQPPPGIAGALDSGLTVSPPNVVQWLVCFALRVFLWPFFFSAGAKEIRCPPSHSHFISLVFRPVVFGYPRALYFPQPPPPPPLCRPNVSRSSTVYFFFLTAPPPLVPPC